LESENVLVGLPWTDRGKKDVNWLFRKICSFIFKRKVREILYEKYEEIHKMSTGIFKPVEFTSQSSFP
jgi:hypothetical protein